MGHNFTVHPSNLTSVSSEYKGRKSCYDFEVPIFVHQTGMSAERVPVGEASATTLGAASDVTVQLALIFPRMVSPALVLSGLTPGLFIVLHTEFFPRWQKHMGIQIFSY